MILERGALAFLLDLSMEDAALGAIQIAYVAAVLRSRSAFQASD